MSGDKAVLMLVDRLADVLILRADESAKAVVSPGGIVQGIKVDYHDLPDRAAMLDAQKASDANRIADYYALLEAWKITRSGPEPVKPHWIEIREAAARVAQAYSAPGDGRFKPRLP